MISPLLRGQSGCPADQTAEVVAPPKSCLLRHLPDRQTGRPQQFKCPFETAGLQIGDRRLAGCPADKPVDRGTMNSHGVGQSVDIEITVSAFALDPVETLFGERIRRIVIPGVSPHPHQKLDVDRQQRPIRFFARRDHPARQTLEELLTRVVRESNVQIILSVSAPTDIPEFITHVYTVDDMQCGKKQTRAEFFANEPYTRHKKELDATYRAHPISLPAPTRKPIECDEIVRMQNVTIRYGERTILDSLDWTIRNGEKWTLTGPNGAGKSTLLCLISADNPQSYAQDISLFGRQRGSGESIWDIKKHIGYVSPEMHRSYMKHIPAIDIVASGFFDSIGLYLKPNEEQRAICDEWLKAFGIEKLRDRSFVKLSSGEQRLLLLARAFVKDPDLLILDEPLHGLDCYNKERARAVIEAFCERPAKTLIYVTHYENELPRCIDREKRLERH